MATVHGIPSNAPSSGGATDHGALMGLGDDDHIQYLLLAGRVGGQVANGGTGSSQELVLRGTAGVNLGQIRCQSPIDFDDIQAANALNPYFVQANPTQTFTGAFIGGGANYSPIITFNHPVTIWEGMRISPNITSNVAPSFAAFTLLQALPVLRSVTAGFNPLSALTLNVGVTMENAGVVVALAASNNFGMSFSPQTRVTGVFSSMSVTNQTAVSCRPTFSTIATSIANLGTIRGIHQQSPGVALFQPQAGSENMTANIAVDVDNISFGGNVLKASVRSAQAAATNSYFLLNNGTARSSFGNSNIEFNDIFGVVFGNSQDLGLGWAGASNELFFNFVASGDDIRFSNPSANRILIQGDVQNTEFNINCDRFSMGAQSGSVGNQVGAFVTPTRTVTVGGGWSDFLLTHAGNITVDAALSQLAAWTINAPSITIGTGSVVDAVGLLIGGNPNAGTNRYGLQVISNPSGGTLNYCARFSGAAGVRVDGILEHAGATLGLFGTTPAVQPPAYTPINVVTDRAYDADSTTTAELADVLGTLIADLQSLGVVQ